MLRVTGGAARGCRLALPPCASVRPATDRLRESLFAVLTPSLTGVRVLDLFAGSGVLGLEALSRGSSHCTFVENDAAAVRVLAENVQSVGFPGKSTILVEDLRKKITLAERVQVAFLDPPFAMFKTVEGLSALSELLGDLADRLVAAGGLVVLRHEDTAEMEVQGLLEAAAYEITDARTYGRSRVKVLRVV